MAEKNRVILRETPCQYPKTIFSIYAYTILTWADNLKKQQDAIACEEQHVETRAVGHEALPTLRVVQVEAVLFPEIHLHFRSVLRKASCLKRPQKWQCALR